MLKHIFNEGLKYNTEGSGGGVVGFNVQSRRNSLSLMTSFLEQKTHIKKFFYSHLK